MKQKIILSIDLEEYDIPLEYGQTISMDEQIEVSKKGMLALQQLFEKHEIKTTIFTTAYFAEREKELLQNLSKTHEIGSHGYFHASFDTADLVSSKTTIENIIQKNVEGFRMPRLMPVDNRILKEANYKYDSSVNPTFIPGRYDNRHYPRTIFEDPFLKIIPTSVSPFFRLPLFWLSFKNLPTPYYHWLCRRALQKDGYLSLYFHPWEFANIESYQLPFYVKRKSGEALINRLENFILAFKKEATFTSYQTLLLDYKK